MSPTAAVPKRPHLDYEAALLSRGCVAVAGLDEVGRGTLAGPVVAGAVILPSACAGGWLRLINDSKKLTPAQRDEACAEITSRCVSHATGGCDSAEIDRMGIVAATRTAMARAIELLEPQPDHLLIDALSLRAVRIPQTPIIKGDAISLSIAAASIVAKVTRDRLMATVLEGRYPGYGFAEHKGYGTAEHLSALRRMGPTPIHRMTFAPVRELLTVSWHNGMHAPSSSLRRSGSGSMSAVQGAAGAAVTGARVVGYEAAG